MKGSHLTHAPINRIDGIVYSIGMAIPPTGTERQGFCRLRISVLESYVTNVEWRPLYRPWGELVIVRLNLYSQLMTFRAKSGGSIWNMVSRRLHASDLTVKRFRLLLWPGTGITGMPTLSRIWGSVVLVTYWKRPRRGIFCWRLATGVWRVDTCNCKSSLCTRLNFIMHPQDKGEQRCLFWNNMTQLPLQVTRGFRKQANKQTTANQCQDAED